MVARETKYSWHLLGKSDDRPGQSRAREAASMRLAPLRRPSTAGTAMTGVVAGHGCNVSSGCTPKRAAREESRGRHRAVSRGQEKLRRQFNVTPGLK
jgi:hypothetical protein